jgi:hypothetical protein
MHCECDDIKYDDIHGNDCLIGAISEGAAAVAKALYALGNGNADTNWGAIEGHAVKTGDGLDRIADAVGEISRMAAFLDLDLKFPGPSPD